MNVVPFTPLWTSPFTSVNRKMARTASSAGTSTPVGRAIPERWVVGKAYSANYYYDAITDDALPPKQIDLSDYWVVKVVKAGIGPKERQTFWPAVFTSKIIKVAKSFRSSSLYNHGDLRHRELDRRRNDWSNPKNNRYQERESDFDNRNRSYDRSSSGRTDRSRSPLNSTYSNRREASRFDGWRARFSERVAESTQELCQSSTANSWDT